MAGWSILESGLDLDYADITNSCCKDFNHGAHDGIVNEDAEDDDDYEVKLFDQVLSVFLDEADIKGCIRPLPVMLGDGQALDLFKLFWLVRKRGGFDLVSGFWSFVARELGLDIKASASLKLIYFKYLYEFEQWLRGKCSIKRFGSGECRNDENLGALMLELETGFTKLLPHGRDLKAKNCALSLSKDQRIGNYIGLPAGKSESCLSDTKDEHIICNRSGKWQSDDDENICNGEEGHGKNGDSDFFILDLYKGKKEFNSLKRKRDSLSKMLSWMVQIAKCPDDPSIGTLPSSSKWKNHSGKELWIQAIRARNALVQRIPADSNGQHCLSQSTQFTNGLRCGEQHPALPKLHLCVCSNSCSPPQTKRIKTPKKGFEHVHANHALVADESCLASRMISASAGEHFRRPVFVGPRFQAEVPKWTGIVSESDTKWLGTKVWPSKQSDCDAEYKLEPIGKGRADICDCNIPGSVQCVRFHIAERRMKLKRELGPVFFYWKLDRMGEEVSIRWTAEEEKSFKDMVRCNPPSLERSFWVDARNYFPRKARDDLVSYYFNVFVLRRRRYQNRATPNEIDSDDDEAEFGSFSFDYGHEAVNVPGENILLCLENKQSTDFR